MTELTPALIDEICLYLGDVGFEEVACQMAGVPVEEFNSWLDKAKTKEANEMHLQLAKAVRIGSINFEASHIKNVHYAGMNGDVEASKFILKSKAPERWEKKTDIKDTLSDINITITAKKPTHQIERTAEENDIIDI